MKFSMTAVLAAIAYLGPATTATMTATKATTTTLSHRRGLKTSKGSKRGKFKLLAVQKGQGCYIAEVEIGVYTLVITKMNRDTIQFQERPGRGASTISTGDFTEEFSMYFPVDDLPNTAITFADSNENEDQGTLIVKLSNPSPFNNGTGMKYTVEQSPSQSDVVSLEQSVVENDGDPVDNSCSLFIDGYGNIGAPLQSEEDMLPASFFITDSPQDQEQEPEPSDWLPSSNEGKKK